MPTTMRSTNRVLTTERDISQVKAVLNGPHELYVEAAPGEMQPLPRETGELVQHLLRSIANGTVVTFAKAPDELTTTAAAAILGISRPTLMRMINTGEIPFHKVGTHTRLRAEDVFAQRTARRERERAAFDRLRDLEAELTP